MVNDERGKGARNRDLDADALMIFADSLELAEDAREAWLIERCADNAALLEAVLRLQAADRSADKDFLRSPLAPLSDAPSMIGQRFGAFEVTSLLGSGGMGRVFRARRVEGAFEQEVAIKCFDIRYASDNARERFESERRILAALEHPGIAHVIDGGTTDDGAAYLVMELVRGQRITDYCTDQGLSLEARLRLFQRVCSAIQFAHQQGVVHRDLKPGNILVTRDGDPRLIDFGIAKVLDPAFVREALPETRTSAQLMTPEYASPEQVRGEQVGIGSDIYSMGILLYELLVGTRPYHFPSLTPAAIERTVCDSIPSNPSALVGQRRGELPSGLDSARSLSRRLRGDLDCIVMTALSKEPARRFVSAAAMADDIERYLGGHPVRARGVSRSYRILKFVQRNRAASAALAMVVLTLVIALAVVMNQAAETERQRDVAQREAARATAAKDFLIDIIARSDPYENTESATLAGALRQSLPGIEERFANNPALEAEMRYAIGYALQNLGEIPTARAQMERARDLWQEVGDSLDQAQVLDGLGIINWWESNFDQGETRFAEALEALDLVQFTTDMQRERATLLRVNIFNNLSGMRIDAGQIDASLAASDAALTLAEDPQWAGMVDTETMASIWGNRANALGSIEERMSEAIVAFERALELQIESTGRLHPNTAIILNNLALTHYGMGNLEDMAMLFEESLEIRRATLGPEHPQTATALFNLAAGQVAAGLYGAAEPNAVEALRVATKGYEPGHPRIGKAHEKLAQVYQATGRVELARTHARQALEIYQAAPGVDPAWISTVEGILAALEETS